MRGLEREWRCLRLLALAGGIAFALAAQPAWAIPALVQNGGFESGTFSPGWSVVGNPNYVAVYGTVAGISPEEGSYFATFSDTAGGGAGGISQTVLTTPGQTYVLSCWFCNSEGADALNEFKITWNTEVLLDRVNFPHLPWTNYTFSVTGTGSDVVAFTGYQNVSWNGLDNVSLTPGSPVPEPVTMLSAFLAISGLGAYIRRRMRVGVA